jgi:hypothetical protein
MDTNTRQAIRLKRAVFPADGVEVLIFREIEPGLLEAVTNIEYSPTDGVTALGHCLTMSVGDAEHLMLDLWEAGIRVPQAEKEAEKKAQAGKVEAERREVDRKAEEAKKELERKLEQDRKAHMDDLRNVAMGLIKCLQPKV